MSERYTRLFSLPENLGLEGCPVVISAGALLKDNTTGNVLAQLKFRNLTSQAVKAVKVKIHAYDTAKTELNGVDAFSYQNLNIPLDGEFGSQTPIPLPDAATRSFTVDILSVVLAGGTVYSPIEAQTTSSEEVLDKVKQLDKGRIAQAEKIQRQQRLFRLSFIPLLLAVIALICGLYSRYLGNGYMYMDIDIKTAFAQTLRSYLGYPSWLCTVFLILAFIIPCICILSGCYSKQFPKVQKIAFGICILCTVIQIFIATCGPGLISGNATLRSLAMFYVRGGRLRCYYSYLVGAWEDQPTLLSFIKIFNIRLLEFLEALFWVAKNISAAVILYLQAKNAKSK